MLKRRALAALGLWMGCAGAWADEGIAALEKEITARWEKIQSFTAIMTSAVSMDVNGQTLRSDGEGPVELMRKGEKLLIRSELKTVTLVKAGGQDMKLNQSQTIISDGEHDYTAKEAMGRTQYFKSKPKAYRSVSPAAIFADMREAGEPRKLDDAKVEDAECFVVESAAKSKAKGPVAKTRYSFSKQTGMLLKQENFNEKGEAVETTTFKDVKLDPTIDPERFVFKAPEGAKITEQDGAAGGRPAKKPKENP